MAYLLDIEQLKSGLIIYHRADVKHREWYCRIKVPKIDRYKVVSLKTTDRETAREKAFEHDADVRFRLKHARNARRDQTLEGASGNREEQLLLPPYLRHAQIE